MSLLKSNISCETPRPRKHHARIFRSWSPAHRRAPWGSSSPLSPAMSNAARTRRIFDLRTEARAAPFSMLVMVESNEVVRARVFRRSLRPRHRQGLTVCPLGARLACT